MEDVATRLKDASEACRAAYDGWKDNRKDGAAREALQESVHELRKVASRLEIEVAVSERDEMAQKPIPIPPHRDARKRHNNNNNNNNNNDDRGNQNNDGGGDNNQQGAGRTRTRRGPRKAAGGGNDE
ncbi:MAG: hypothetical protein ACPGRX_07680 [Bdellovibrionales bacterium]